MSIAIETVSFACNSRRLREAIRICNCVREESTRYQLDSIRWFSKRGSANVYLEATDGKRIVRVYIDSVDPEVQFDIVTEIPRPCKLPKVSARVNVIVPFNTLRTNVVVEINEPRSGNVSERVERTLYFPAIDGRYPRTDDIIDTHQPSSPWQCHLRGTAHSLLCMFPETRGTLLTANGKQKVQSTGIQSYSNATLEVVEGKATDIGFSNEYVRDFANWIDEDDKVDLYVFSADEPALFVHGSITYVLMPVSIS